MECLALADQVSAGGGCGGIASAGVLTRVPLS
jgi:hypothetical protein